MDDEQYEIAQAALKRHFDDSHGEAVTDDNLQSILSEALYATYLTRRAGEGENVLLTAEDDAIMIVQNLDTIGPILEAYWSNK